MRRSVSTTRPSASTSSWCRATSSPCSASAPAAGRVFNSQEDDQTYQGHPVVVISYDYWNRRFNRDPGAIGKKILVNNYPMTIVGVSAAGFAGIDPARSPQMRVPIQMKPVIVPEWGWVRMDDERTRWVQVFGRLKPGYTIESAQAPLQGLFTQIRQHEMTLPGAKYFNAYIREQFMKGQLKLERADIGYSPLRNDFSTALVVLMGMVGLVLLIACANVANLLIARGFMRQREIAVRLSLGATRGQLVRQLLTESVLLSLIGGALGIALVGGADARVDRADPAAAAAADSADAGSAHPQLHVRADAGHGRRVWPAARASREQARSVGDVEGHGRRRGGVGRVAVPAQGARRRASRAQLPVAVRRRTVRPQPAEPADHRHRNPDGQPDHVQVVAGVERLRRAADRELLHRAAGTVELVGRHQVCRPGVGRHPRRRRMGQHHRRRRPRRQGRRGHAGVHERAVARLFHDHGHPLHRGPRFHGGATSRKTTTS